MSHCIATSSEPTLVVPSAVTRYFSLSTLKAQLLRLGEDFNNVVPSPAEEEAISAVRPPLSSPTPLPVSRFLETLSPHR